MTYMLILNCALKLVEEIILYYDARSKTHQIPLKFFFKPVRSSYSISESLQNNPIIKCVIEVDVFCYSSGKLTATNYKFCVWSND